MRNGKLGRERVGQRRSAVVRMPENYEQAFGHADAQIKPGEVLVWDAERWEFVPPAELRATKTVPTTGYLAALGLPAVHDDSSGRADWNPGLGVGHESRSDMKRKLAEINRRRDERGDPRLIPAG